MTNPLPQPGSADANPVDPQPADAVDPPEASPPKPVRKGPRRASAAAGTPKRASTNAVMVLDAAGVIVPAKVSPLPETDDAGAAPLPASVPGAVVREADDAIVGQDADAAPFAQEKGKPKKKRKVKGRAKKSAGADAPVAAVVVQDATAAAGDAGLDQAPALPDAVGEMPGTPSGATPVVDEGAATLDKAPDAAATEGSGGKPGEKREAEPVSEPVLEPSIEPAAEPSVEPTVDSAMVMAVEPPAAPHADAAAEPDTEPDAEPSPADADPADVEAAPERETPAAEPLPVEQASAPEEHSTAVAEPAPQSRRERRLAEQKGGVAPLTSRQATHAGTVATVAAVAAVAEGSPAPAEDPLESKNGGEDPSVPADGRVRGKAKKGKPKRKRNRLVATLRGLLFLIVISVLVIGMGTVLSGKSAPTAGPTKTEAHRQAAWEKTSALVQQVDAIAASGEQPKLTQVLESTATDLKLQLVALGDGLAPNTAMATESAGAQAPAGLDQLIADLQSSGSELLDNAVSADHAMGRVFAAVGTSQLMRGRTLGAASGISPAATAWLPATVTFPLPAGPECKSTLEPRPGVSVDSALREAAEGEQKAVYAYQATTPKLTEPQFTQAEDFLARHQEKLTLLNAELHVRCLPTVVPVAGYELSEEFTSAPESALAKLEMELAASYADLAALSTAPVSPDAAGSAGATAAANSAAATARAANPETSTGGTGATQANTSLLRLVSVTWLLDSTRSNLLWGGPLEPLAGVPAETAATAP